MKKSLTNTYIKYNTRDLVQYQHKLYISCCLIILYSPTIVTHNAHPPRPVVRPTMRPTTRKYILSLVGLNLPCDHIDGIIRPKMGDCGQRGSVRSIVKSTARQRIPEFVNLNLPFGNVTGLIGITLSSADDRLRLTSSRTYLSQRVRMRS